ncbi:hypothetical protein THI4931_23760 [Pandoraea sputorum]|nr:hypothetical protein THI4931_23760 [Pandoraea sputorum]
MQRAGKKLFARARLTENQYGQATVDEAFAAREQIAHAGVGAAQIVDGEVIGPELMGGLGRGWSGWHAYDTLGKRGDVIECGIGTMGTGCAEGGGVADRSSGGGRYSEVSGHDLSPSRIGTKGRRRWLVAWRFLTSLYVAAGSGDLPPKQDTTAQS